MVLSCSCANIIVPVLLSLDGQWVFSYYTAKIFFYATSAVHFLLFTLYEMESK